MRTIIKGAALLTLALGFAGTATAQTSTTTIRPGQLQAPSQPFMNFFPSPAKVLNILTFSTPTATNSMPQSYLQQFGYQRPWGANTFWFGRWW
jgi:hypothetical protein